MDAEHKQPGSDRNATRQRVDLLRRALRDPDRGVVRGVMFSLRRRVLTGALVMIPLVISFVPVLFIYPKLNSFGREYLGIKETLPGVGFLVALSLVLVILYIVGVLSATFVVRWAVKVGEKILNQIPVVNFCYRTTKQVVDLVATQASKPFKKVVLIEYPRKGIYAMGFVTGEGDYPLEPGRQARSPLVHIFIPTTPNPTSGFLLLFRPEEVTETGLTIDEAVRFIISGGILDMGDLQPREFQSDLPPTAALAEPSPVPDDPLS
jgi:uncharacterized membrane protein